MSTDRVLIGVLVGCVAVWGTAQALPAAAWLAVVSVLFGGVITGLFSWYYYGQASEELRKEAARLRQQTTFVMRALETGIPAKFIWDRRTGEPIGNRYEGEAVVRLLLLESERAEKSPADTPEPRPGTPPPGPAE
jgi:phosphatidylglycerophosphate synthase